MRLVIEHLLLSDAKTDVTAVFTDGTSKNITVKVESKLRWDPAGKPLHNTWYTYTTRKALHFDPHYDPRAEKSGRKQWSKAHLRVRKSRGKPALFSRKPAEDVPIESSHA